MFGLSTSKGGAAGAGGHEDPSLCVLSLTQLGNVGLLAACGGESGCTANAARRDNGK